MQPIQFQKVIDYMEENLTGELSFEEIASLFAVSESDLQRSFKTVTGMTISEYIRCRRLTCAALAIKNDGMKVLDAALLYGYQTAESFAKAFKQYHGCTPLEAKNQGQTIRYCRPIVIKLAKRGGMTIDYAPYQEKADSIVDYYSAGEEDGRLTRSRHASLEFAVTMHYFDKLFEKNSRILDCCAGTGTYAFALAGQHRVTASDLTPKNVQIMQAHQQDNPQLEQILQLDVCKLDCFADGSFDVVLCMGALYHLFDRERREQAVRECSRVCRKGGLLAFTYLNKWGNFFNGMVNNLKSMELLYQEYESGNHENIFFRTTAEEIDALCAEQGLERLCNIGVDHLAYLASETVDAMDEEEYQKLLDYQLKASAEPNIAGMSLHGLWIGRK